MNVAKPQTPAEKVTRTVMDTIMVTPMIVSKWKAPPFQRPVKDTARKVMELAKSLQQDGGVWPGVVTLGVLNGETYVIDGQHRRSAFLQSGLKEGYTDVRIHYMSTVAEMGEEFVKLNSQLVRMGPDDILRGLEAALPAIQYIRKECHFVGYGQIRHGNPTSTPLISMAVVIRCWTASKTEIPNTHGSAQELALAFSIDDAHLLCGYLAIAKNAFGTDPQYYRLWSALNLMLTMWLYRRMVLDPIPPGKRWTKLSKELFQKCLMSLSASPLYLDWLVGRQMAERDRGPAYVRIRELFSRRLREELGGNVKMPQPVWFNI